MTTPKIIRGQVRQIVNEVLPSLLESEFGKQVFDRLHKVLTGQLEDVKKNVLDHLNEMNERSKAMQSYVERQVQAELDRNISKQAPVSMDAPESDETILLVNERTVQSL